MESVIVVHPSFEAHWPFSGDHMHELWKRQGLVEFIRLKPGDDRVLGDVVAEPGEVRRLIDFGVQATVGCMERFASLREAAFSRIDGLAPEVTKSLAARGVKLRAHRSEGYWGQSVAEFALGLTICGLRRIPQLHCEIIRSRDPWDYSPPGGVGQPGQRGGQFGDDPDFVNGTVAGKRVRIVGAGNIGSRYAGFVHALGADVAIWDPFAPDPCFHRAGARREWHLDRLMRDAEIFAPMVPLKESTRGLITADHIDMLPRGCLVVLSTRARICDMSAVRRRVVRDEIALAADVFDIEPLPLEDELLGRGNVVHTPHNAGRTIDANRAFAEELAAQFEP